MSWQLREYFVITEYLIEEFYVPLIPGLTMADDFNTVTEKMIKSTEGQNGGVSNVINIANHVDYSKWNNHQRGAANNPVILVIGKFVGYRRQTFACAGTDNWEGVRAFVKRGG